MSHRASHEQSIDAMSHEPCGFARAFGLLSSELTARVNETSEITHGAQPAQVDPVGGPATTLVEESGHIIDTSAKRGLGIDVDNSLDDSRKVGI